MTLAGRFDRYTDFGEIFNPQYGLLWRPFRDVTLRATYGRSFRPPSLFDLYQPAVPVGTHAPGLRAAIASSPTVKVIGGGNRELEATHGESFTAGVEFTPEAIRPLTLSATYWHVEMDNRVTALTVGVRAHT